MPYRYFAARDAREDGTSHLFWRYDVNEGKGCWIDKVTLEFAASSGFSLEHMQKYHMIECFPEEPIDLGL